MDELVLQDICGYILLNCIYKPVLDFSGIDLFVPPVLTMISVHSLAYISYIVKVHFE